MRSVESGKAPLAAVRLGEEPHAGWAFRLFGPLTALRDGVPVDLGSPQQRALLALLLLHRNETVSTDRLIDLLWGDEPPRNALETLRVYVSRLRRVLETAPTAPRVLLTDPTGYRLVVPPGGLDVQRFEELADRGRAALETGDDLDAERDLVTALAIAKSPPLPDFEYEDVARGERARLEELRVWATEEHVEARLRLGRHAEIVTELQGLAANHPERERIWGQLMVALYRSGRQAEALQAFRDARQWLATELGLDPSRDLQRLHQQILRQDPALDLGVKALRSYRLLERVGAGAHGVVWRATQPSVGREVAVKEIHPHLANSPEFIRRFEAEAQLVARLEHPHIVPLYDYWREPAGAYLVMRYLRGGSLRDVLALGSVDTDRAVRLVEHVSLALVAAHRQGIVHRDIKPANILFDDEGNAYLADFGIARELAAESRGRDGTPSPLAYYLSPEEVRGEPVTPRTDIYSLGLVLYEALAGRHPFADTSPQEVAARHLHDPVPAIGSVRRDLPRAVEGVIERATAKDPGERYAEATELAADFRDAVSPAVTRSATTPRLEARNPYKGLRPFLEPDAGDFFGRQALIDELVARMREQGEGSRFLAVVGPSGGGKSSVVRAGLVPALRGGALPGSEGWFVVEMSPGAHPLEELEAALLRVAADPTPLIDELERDESGFLRSVERVLPDEGSELVLVVDQFEEVFTLLEDEARRSHFLRSLLAAITDPGSRVRIVTTLRADFYDRPLSYRGLAELIKTRTVTVTPLTPEEVERAITGPAERVGVGPDPALVAGIVADVADQPGALPLLQYTLTELFERKRAGVLTIGAYRAIGGVSGALARRAEEIYGGLNETERDAAQQLFIRLVTLEEGFDDTRRRVPKELLAALEVDGGAVDQVIDGFGAHRLLSFDRDPVTRGATVEVAHEALLREWGRLRGWIDRAREDLRMERRLAFAAGEWEEAGRDPGFLLRGGRLEQLEAWAETTGLALTRPERALLEASMAARDAERAQEEERLARERALERRSIARLRMLVGVLTVAAVAAGGLTLFANAQRGRAVRESQRAEQETRTATARELVAATVANLEVDPELSILLALEAIETSRAADGSVLPEAEEALHRAVGASRIVMSVPGVGGALDWSPDGGLFVTEGPEDAGIVDIRDPATGKTVLAFPGHNDINNLAFSADGSMLATAGDDGTVKVWRPSTGDEVAVLRGPRGPVWGPSFSLDGKLVAAAWLEEDGQVRVWEVATGRTVLTIAPLTGPSGAAFSPDGTRLAVPLLEPGAAYIFDVDTGKRVLALRGHNDSVGHASWSPDGRWIATTSFDTITRIWDPETGELRFTLSGHSGAMNLARWSPDSSRLATGSADGTAKVWDVSETGAREVLTLSAGAHTQSGINGLAFSPDGSRLMTGDVDITSVKVWDLGLMGDAEWATVPADPVWDTEAAFMPDGERVVAGRGRGRATVWDAKTGHSLLTVGPHEHSGDPAETSVFAIAVTPDGELIATGSNDQTARVWDAAGGAEMVRVPHEGPVAGLDWSPDGAHLATLTEGGPVRVLDREGTEVTVLPREGFFPGVAVRFSPDGRLLAVSDATEDGDESVIIRDWRQDEIVQTVDTGALDVAFDPTGTRIATPGEGSRGWVEIWNVKDGARVAILSGQRGGAIMSVAFSPDGSRIATGGFDDPVRVWDVKAGVQLLELRGHDGSVFDVTFSPDGSRLASVSPDGTARVWALDLEDLIRIARRKVTRSMTDSECLQYLRLDRCSED